MNDLSQQKPQPKFIRSHGLKFPNDPNVVSQKVRRLLRTDSYEQKEFDAVRALVKPDDVVLELGAGMGFMSTVAAKLCKAKSVHAYEANPAMIPYIRSVHAINSVETVTVTNALLAPKAGDPVDFYVRGNFLASSMQDNLGDQEGGVISVEKVDVHDINTVLQDLAPTFLICDIEGAEATLLPSADLSCLRCAVIELHPQWIGKEGVQAVFDTMLAAGLTFFPNRSHKKVVTFRKDW